MRKIIFNLTFIVSILILACSFTSCRKCKHCTWSANGTVVLSGEFCGKDLKEAEDTGGDCK
jgi:hypothetical protein